MIKYEAFIVVKSKKNYFERINNLYFFDFASALNPNTSAPM